VIVAIRDTKRKKKEEKGVIGPGAPGPLGGSEEKERERRKAASRCLLIWFAGTQRKGKEIDTVNLNGLGDSALEGGGGSPVMRPRKKKSFLSLLGEGKSASSLGRGGERGRIHFSLATLGRKKEGGRGGGEIPSNSTGMKRKRGKRKDTLSIKSNKKKEEGGGKGFVTFHSPPKC